MLYYDTDKENEEYFGKGKKMTKTLLTRSFNFIEETKEQALFVSQQSFDVVRSHMDTRGRERCLS